MSIITDPEARLKWREHLTAVAISEEQCEWEQGEYDEDEHKAFIRGMALLIGNATWLEEESTGDVEDAAYQTLMTTRKAQARERWVRAVNTGATDKGFEEWLADRT